MRLRDVVGILQKNIPKLAAPSTPAQLAGIPGQYFQVDGLEPLREALRSLSVLPQLRAPANSLLQTVPLSLGQPSVTMELTARGEFVNGLEVLRNTASSLKSLLDLSLQDEPPLAFSMRLPDIASLGDLQEITKELDLILNQTLLQHYGFGNYRLSGFDTGSMWINITLDTPEALGLILTVYGAAKLWLRKKADTAKQLESTNAALPESDRQTMAKLLQQMLDHERVKMAESVAPKGASPEDIQRLRHALERLAALEEQGAEIVPSLQAPEAVREIYVQINKGVLPPQPLVRQLGAGSSETAEPEDEAKD